MRGVAFSGDCRVEFIDVPDPTPGAGEVVLAVKASGMCGSDLHYYRAPSASASTQIIRGHEPCGVIAAVGPGVTGPFARVGTRVMVHHYHGCTACNQCRSGWPQMCCDVPMIVYGTDEHGAHAPYIKVPATTLIHLDDRLSYAAGAAISCGTGTAWGAFERMGLTARDTLAVFGQGPVGLSATMLGKALGARVIALDIDPERLARAKEFGADLVIDSRDGNVPQAVKEATDGEGATMVLETSGAARANYDALRAAARWGTIGLVGIGSELTFSLGELLRRQLRIIPSWTMSIQGQKACADFVIKHGLDVDALFTDQWALDQAGTAYEKFNKQSGGKGVFLI